MKNGYIGLLWFVTGVLGIIALFILSDYMDIIGSAGPIKSISNAIFIIPICCIIIINIFIKKLIFKIFNTKKFDDILDIISIQIYFIMFIILFKFNPDFINIIDKIIK